MGLILGIIQAFLNASGMVLTKKIVENRSIHNNFLTFLNRGYHLIIVGILFLIGFFDYNLKEANISINDFILLIIAASAIYISYPLRIIAYANEKVSVLQPYAMLYQVFPISIGFIFITSERTNIITFLTAIIASLVVILANINFKNIKINKYSLMVLLSSIIKSFQLFAAIYLLTKFNPASFYFTETIIIIVISIILIIIKKEFIDYKFLTKNFVKLIIFANSIILFSILLSLTLYKTLGVVATSLLSLLYLLFVYILGYFILKEEPAKKDLIVTGLVVICILVGIYFKN